MFRRSALSQQAQRPLGELNINRPQEQSQSSWNNDPRYGEKQIKTGDPDPMIQRFMKAAPKYTPKMIKARIISNNGKIFFGILAFGVAGYFIEPIFRKHNNETRGMPRLTLEGAESMLEHSPRWWSNQWRKGAVEWRAAESFEGFYIPNFNWIRENTGRDMLAPPVVPLTAKDQEDVNAKPRKGMWKALVPLSGDSPIVRILAERGYFVNAVDCSEIAMQSLSRHLKFHLAKELTWNVKLHWTDFFNSDLWAITPSGLTAEEKAARALRSESNQPKYVTDRTVETNMLVMPDIDVGLKGEQFDLIYDRQALSTFHPSARTDYAYLLKRALKDDGVLFVEGIFRTGRVKGNKVKGPPFGVSEAQLSELFPADEGFAVKCDNSIPDSIFTLDKTHRILGSIPKELYTTPMPCVVWKPGRQPANVSVNSKVKL